MPSVLRAAALALLLSAGAAAAQDAGGWQVREGGRFRLIEGEAPGPDAALVVLEARLDKGWKLYGRAPGKFGLPMRFDFAASENVAAAEPLFPVPARLTEAGEEVIGYQGVAGFPIRIALAGRPAQLAVHVELGLCREICQGVELDLSRPLGQPDDPAAARRFVAALPRRAADAGVAIRAAVSPEGDGVVVHVQAPRPLDRPDLFLEARPEDSYAAQPLELAADRRSATFRLDAERTLAPGERVTVILVSGGEGFEEALALAPP